jgi:hypothetical protein
MAYPQLPLRKDGEGYVYWKGIQVEHFSFRGDDAAEQQAYVELEAHCLHLEQLGVPVSSSTVCWFSTWFEAMDKNHPFLAFMRDIPSLWVKPTQLLSQSNLPDGYYLSPNDGDQLLISRKGKSYLWDRNAKTLTTVPTPEDYHAYVALGWHTANVGQNVENGCGLCYGTTEGVTAFLRRMNIPDGFTLPE